MNRQPVENFEQLARRAIACKHWRWMEGMAALNIAPQGVYRSQSRVVGKAAAKQVPGNLIPDLTDPATLGCLLVLVRSAWGNYTLHVRIDPFDAQWAWVSDSAGNRTFSGNGLIDTEAAALVAALEAAP